MGLTNSKGECCPHPGHPARHVLHRAKHDSAGAQGASGACAAAGCSDYFKVMAILKTSAACIDDMRLLIEENLSPDDRDFPQVIKATELGACTRI